jgi:hypothetical protein
MPRYYGIQERNAGAAQGNLTMRVPITVLSTGEKDTGHDLRTGDVVEEVYLDVKTAEATSGTKTIDVGLLSSESGGDTDGFLDGVSTAAAVVVQGSLDSAGQTLGTLLHVDESGAGVLTRQPYIVAAATSIVYQLGAAHTELDADIVIKFFRPVA